MHLGVWIRSLAGLTLTVLAVLFLQWQMGSAESDPVIRIAVGFVQGVVLLTGLSASCLYLYVKLKDKREIDTSYMPLETGPN